MKTKNKELDVDFIGGQGPLTTEEEHAVTEFIKNQKLVRENKLKRIRRSKKNLKIAQ
ncbi:MAG: hypothetical protein IPK62_04665 [Bacteroidetes bacterium]|nr:hypothetical protein [Bacteroidota bacterium]MBK8144332.1 hypothetical protein [Bacteroidota bacterium]MBP6314341.1 hypothetical protein [Chitinophagaceae bacterium]